MIFLFFYLLKAVKDKYVAMMEAYKEGFNSGLVGFQQENEQGPRLLVLVRFMTKTCNN